MNKYRVWMSPALSETVTVSAMSVKEEMLFAGRLPFLVFRNKDSVVAVFQEWSAWVRVSEAAWVRASEVTDGDD